MGRTKLAAALALAMTIGCAVFAIDAAPPVTTKATPAAGQYVIHFKMIRINNDGSKSVLAEPSVVVSPGVEAYFLSGGEMELAERKVPIGVRMQVTATPADDGRVSLVGMIERAEIVDRGNGVVSRHSDEDYFKQTVKLNKQIRMPLSSGLDSTQWIELTVAKEDELFDGARAASKSAPAKR